MTCLLFSRKLHCPRNTVHVNMFVSFILRAIISFLKDMLLVQGLGFSFDVVQTLTDTVLFTERGTVSVNIYNKHTCFMLYCV